MSVDDLGIHK